MPGKRPKPRPAQIRRILRTGGPTRSETDHCTTSATGTADPSVHNDLPRKVEQSRPGSRCDATAPGCNSKGADRPSARGRWVARICVGARPGRRFDRLSGPATELSRERLQSLSIDCIASGANWDQREMTKFSIKPLWLNGDDSEEEPTFEEIDLAIEGVGIGNLFDPDTAKRRSARGCQLCS